MNRICAWCKKELGRKEDYVSEGEISHGICSLCSLEMLRDAPRTAREILSLIDEPIFILNSDGVVRAANKRASEILGKKVSDIENQVGGDAFECAYAILEGGCGNTVHCVTCALRNLVKDTLTTGYGYKEVPAFQNILTPDGEKILKFHISTERIEEQILLRIDSME